MIAVTESNGDPIAKHLSCWYMSEPTWKYVDFILNVNISIRFSVDVHVHFPSERSDSNLSGSTDRTASVETLMNSFTSKFATSFI